MINKIRYNTTFVNHKIGITKDTYMINIIYEDNRFNILEIEDIFQNELSLLILCYLTHNNRDNNIFQDKNFSWLKDYCYENKYLLESYQSAKLEIYYFDNFGEKFDIKLPDISEIFKSEKEGIDYINNLYDQQRINTKN